MLRVMLVGALLFLTGCAIPKLGKNYEFKSSDEKGFVALIGTPGIANDSGGRGLFMLDYANKKVIKHVAGCVRCAGEDIFDLGEGEFLYKLIPVEPGTYTFAGFWAVFYSGYYSRHTYHNYCKGSPAFVVEPGKISLVSLNNNSAENLKVLKQKITHSTSITAPVVAAKILSTIQFNCKKHLALNNTPFTVISEMKADKN